MAGTREGGEKAAETRKEKDPDAFKKMGEEGGRKGGQSTNKDGPRAGKSTQNNE